MAGSLVLLDTTALLTLRDDAPGADLVEQAIEQPQRCYACFLSLQWIEASKPLLEQAAWIAAAALQVGATLLHKDPELRAISDLPQTWLG